MISALVAASAQTSHSEDFQFGIGDVQPAEAGRSTFSSEELRICLEIERLWLEAEDKQHQYGLEAKHLEAEENERQYRHEVELLTLREGRGGNGEGNNWTPEAVKVSKHFLQCRNEDKYISFIPIFERVCRQYDVDRKHWVWLLTLLLHGKAV